jgi:hypothetical protein
MDELKESGEAGLRGLAVLVGLDVLRADLDVIEQGRPVPVSRWPKPSQSSSRLTPSADAGTSTEALRAPSIVAVV